MNLAQGRAAVLLDALGTLVGLEPPWQRFTELLAERHGVRADRELAVGALRAEMAYYREHCHRARDAASLAQLRGECAALVARELGRPDLDLVATLLDALRFRPYPEVTASLARLRDGGTRLVVVSNWDVSLHDVLADCGLAALLDGVVTSAEHGSAKPGAAIFAAALELAGCGSAQALHVGDSAAEDVAGARAAGIEAVLLRRAPGPLLAPGAEDGAVSDTLVIAGLDEL